MYRTSAGTWGTDREWLLKRLQNEEVHEQIKTRRIRGIHRIYNYGISICDKSLKHLFGVMHANKVHLLFWSSSAETWKLKNEWPSTIIRLQSGGVHDWTKQMLYNEKNTKGIYAYIILHIQGVEYLYQQGGSFPYKYRQSMLKRLILVNGITRQFESSSLVAPFSKPTNQLNQFNLYKNYSNIFLNEILSVTIRKFEINFYIYIWSIIHKTFLIYSNLYFHLLTVSLSIIFLAERRFFSTRL